MSDTRTEITDDEVSEMMKKIKSKINKRNKVLLCPPSQVSDSTTDPTNTITFEQDLSFIYQSSNIQNEHYVIESHHPVLGYFLVKGRELVNGEVKRYLRPILFKQSLFNGTLVRIISEIKKSLTRNQDSLDLLEQSLTQNQDRLNQIEQSLTQNQDRLNQIEQSLTQNQDRLNQIEQSLTQNQDRLNQTEQSLVDQISVSTADKDKYKLEIMRLIDERYARYESYLKPMDVTQWSTLYSKDVSDKDLVDNIEYHTHFINLIRNCAKLSAKTKIPKLIEIGLGNGTMSIFFSRNELYEVYGIDNDIGVLRYCINNNKKLGGYAKFFLMDAFDLSLLKKKEFDVAFSQGTLEHFDNESIIALLLKQLEIAHYVIFSVPSFNWATREIGNERKMTLEEWRTLLNEGGFNILNLEYYKEDLHIVGVISK
jgi:2-polyprenyl-3-methyl-5-hydroxy-6-metoxy-1,4-benzoquinol methylase